MIIELISIFAMFMITVIGIIAIICIIMMTLIFFNLITKDIDTIEKDIIDDLDQ